MTTKNTSLECNLDSNSIDFISGLIGDFCKGLSIPERDILKYRLTAEECMMVWLENLEGGQKIRFEAGKSLFNNYLRLECSGRPVDPYEGTEETYTNFNRGILNNLGLIPEYSYTNGANVLSFRVRHKQMGQLQQLLITIVISLVVGLLGLLVLPDNILSSVTTGFIGPIYDKFFDLLTCIAGPMVFLSVAWGVYGIGDTITLGRIGKKMMLRYALTDYVVAYFGLISLLVLPLTFSKAAQTSANFNEIFGMILGIIPKNIVEPFSTGNTLQIIFLGFVVGIAMLFLGKQTVAVARAIEQVNYLVQFLMSILSRVVPYFVFIVLVNQLWSGTFAQLSSVWKLFAMFMFLVVFISILFTLRVSIQQKVGFFTIVKKNLPTLLIALTTASSAASFATNVKTSKEKFGVDSSVVNFGIPLGIVMHKPLLAMYFVVSSVFFAGVYGVEVSIPWLFMSTFVSAVLAIATPPIPGGAAAAYAVLFSQLGIPVEAVAVGLAIDMMTDFLVTSGEMYCLPLSLITIASSLGKLDKKILREK